MVNHDNASLVVLLHTSMPPQVFLYMLGSIRLSAVTQTLAQNMSKNYIDVPA